MTDIVKLIHICLGAPISSVVAMAVYHSVRCPVHYLCIRFLICQRPGPPATAPSQNPALSSHKHRFFYPAPQKCPEKCFPPQNQHVTPPVRTTMVVGTPDNPCHVRLSYRRTPQPRYHFTYDVHTGGGGAYTRS